VTFVPEMAIEAGILSGTGVDARPLRSENPYRRIALIWRRSSPREAEFQMLAATLRRIAGGLSAPVTVAEEAPALQLLDS
jgi:LysR family hydrogen peroxide-inducible transcriptional activator